MPHSPSDQAAIDVVRRNAELVQGQGDWTVFEELFAADFVDHTPQQGGGAGRDSVLALYKMMRAALPDWRPEIVWQSVDDGLVTTYKIYHGTHLGTLLGVEPTGKTVAFETVDAMRVVDGQITEHWGVANLLKLFDQLGALTLG